MRERSNPDPEHQQRLEAMARMKKEGALLRFVENPGEPFRRFAGEDMLKIELPENRDYLNWCDWNKVIDGFQESGYEYCEDYYFDESEDANERLKGALQLLTVMSLDAEAFNQLRERYPNEQYADSWNNFLSLFRENFDRVHLHRMVEFNGVDLHGLTLTPFIGEFARLENANLRGADMRSAFLKSVHLQGADCRDAKFDNAMFMNISLDEKTNFEGASFKDATYTEGFSNLAHEMPRPPQWALDQMKQVKLID